MYITSTRLSFHNADLGTYAALQAALEMLGYGPAIHGFNQWMHARDTDMWAERLRAKFFPSTSPTVKPFGRTEFDHLLGEYEIVSDFPSIAFSEELIAAYPEAKVILVERHVETWYKSFKAAIIDSMLDPWMYTIISFDRPLVRFNDMARLCIAGKFGGRTRREFEANARKTYAAHYEMVGRVTQKEMLLDFNLRDGWEPLCEILGKEVPKGVEFPRVNFTEDFWMRLGAISRIAVGRVLMNMLWIFGSVGAAALGILM